jgi:hypothetical protein
MAAQRCDVPHKQCYRQLNTFYDRVAYFVKFRNSAKEDTASAVLGVSMCCSLLYFMGSFQLSFSFRHKICWTAVKFVSSLYCKDCKQFSSVGQTSCYTRVLKNCFLTFVNFQFWSEFYKWRSTWVAVRTYYFAVTPVHAINLLAPEFHISFK